MKKGMVLIYSLIHFLVDLSCAILVTNLVTSKMGQGMSLWWAIVLYNFFAFAVQFPIGILADSVNKNALYAGVGCILVAISFAFAQFGILACIIAGIGNSMYHVGGGIDILNISNKKASLSGIFVATGAIGIFLGSKSLAFGFHDFYLVIITLIIASLLLMWLYFQIKDTVTNEKVLMPSFDKYRMIATVCFFITVVIRGYVGFILNFEWKSNFALAVGAIIAVVLGKMLGGVIGDRVGLMKISAFSLVLSAVLFIFAFQNSILGILAILCFNMTMPITLIALSNMFEHNKGMAFGMLTLALFIGAVPIFFGYTEPFFSPLGLFGIAIFSAVILGLGLKFYQKAVNE